MDLSHWLREIDMGQYEDAFRKNDIDVAILPSLTASDLRELGVASVGHRRRILDAIAAFEGEAVADDGAAVAVTDQFSDHGPERRPLTVLFADLTGSTSLSAALDPEEMGALLKSYQNAVAGEVARYGGHIAKFMGDGVLAYFGWPQADEDVAERAARAGLAIVRAVADLPVPRHPLQARVGVATGLVVVGELVGSGAAREELVVGETPNLAARLQDIAAPGQVVIAPATRALLGQALTLRALPEVALKGFAAPVTPYEVVGEADGLSRFHAKRGRLLLPLIGREGERTALINAWAEADAGRGSGWLVVGPPGIGKSRLIEEIVADALKGTDEPMALQCSPFHGDTAFYPVSRLVTALADLDTAKITTDQQGRIARAMATFGHDPEQAPVLAWILDTGADAAGRGDQDARRAAMKALIGFVHRIAQDLPLLLIVEDVHWSDPTTLELLGRLLPTLVDHRILLLLTSRPELPERLAGDARLNRLVLNRLDIASAERIASGIAGDFSLPAPLLAEIARRADGVPLFVEELTKTMLEASARDDKGGPPDGVRRGEALVIPATLHDSLLSRLDRLGPVKTVAQIASVIGRNFRHDLLRALTGLDEARLEAALERLVAAELIYPAAGGRPQRGAPNQAFDFKHALVRDAAYESLLKSTRRDLHARLYGLLVDDPATPAAVTARHAEAGELPREAMAAWERAGSTALARPAYAEATAGFTAAIRVCQSLGDTDEMLRQELRLTNRLGLAQMGALGYQAGAVGESFQRALSLAEQIGDPNLVFPAVFGLCTHRYTAGQPFAAFGRLVAQAYDLLATLDDKSRRLNAPRVLALQTVRLFHAARYEAAIERVDRVHAVYDSDLTGALVQRYGEDSRITATGYQAWAFSFLGRTDAARAAVAQAVDWARELDHAASLCMALLNGSARNALWLRDLETVMNASAEALNLARRHSLPLWQAYAQLQLGLAVAQIGKAAEVAMLAEGLERFLASGVRVLETPNLTVLAEAQMRLGDLAAAGKTLAAARTAIARSEDLPFAADLARAEARLALADGADKAQARMLLRSALDQAQAQGALLPALRVATDLARLLAEGGAPDRARTLLAPAIAALPATEGPLADLAAARTLADTLS
jgi:class 3 adenylate cyclase